MSTDTKIEVKWGAKASSLRKQYNLSPCSEINGNECILLNEKEQLLDLCKDLKAKHNLQVLSLINAVEYKEAVQVVYQLMGLGEQHELTYLKVNLSRDGELSVPSLAALYDSANWGEREIYDMHGVIFTGHPDLRRILNPAEWEGYPLRKDYIQPLDALNGPISTVKDMGELAHSTRYDIEAVAIAEKKATEELAAAKAAAEKAAAEEAAKAEAETEKKDDK